MHRQELIASLEIQADRCEDRELRSLLDAAAQQAYRDAQAEAAVIFIAGQPMNPPKEDLGHLHRLVVHRAREAAAALTEGEA